MEMKKQQRVVIDINISAARLDFVICDVPCCQVRTFVLYDDQVLEGGRPFVQILLVCELCLVVGIDTPLDALPSPPLQTRQPVTVGSKADPADVVNSVPFGFAKQRRKTMRNDRDRMVRDFVEQGIGRREKIEIGVQISKQINRRILFEDKERQRRRAGEIIF